jgi:enoyl-CoA hydratase
MTWKTIEISRKGAVATLLLNRPARANTLTAELMNELHEAQGQLERDADVRAVIVSGAGSNFCGGRDLQDSENPAPGVALDFALLGKPVIAALNGAALGGGCELALACDFRLASSSASIGLPEIRFGELPAGGGTARLARVVGLSTAKRLMMTGVLVPAHEALKIGLVDSVHEPDDLLPAAHELADKLAAAEPYAIRAAKLLLDRSIETDLSTALAFERQVTLTMATPAERHEARMRAAASNPTYARIFAQLQAPDGSTQQGTGR